MRPKDDVEHGSARHVLLPLARCMRTCKKKSEDDRAPFPSRPNYCLRLRSSLRPRAFRVRNEKRVEVSVAGA